MAVKTFVAGTPATASDANAYLANGGLVWVAEKTWTATMAAQQINNCFSSTYDNYRIVFRGVGNQTTAQALYLLLVDGTTPDTATNYFSSQNYVTNSSGPSMYWSGGTSQWNIGWIADIPTHCIIDLSAPQLASQTVLTSQSAAYGFANTVAGTSNNIKLTTTQYEGLYMYPQAGTTWSGTITVYGYRKA